MKIHKPVHIWDRVFRYNYWISYGVSTKEIHKSIQHYAPEIETTLEHLEDSQGMCWEIEKSGSTIVWIWTKSKSVTTLAHECVHALAFTLVDRVPLGLETDELYAYFIEMLMRNAFKKDTNF